jgi:hypothetical protein
MEISNYKQRVVDFDISSDEYQRSAEIFLDCYRKCIKYEQAGGSISFYQTSKIISKIFSTRTRASFTRTIRAILRTTAGLSADIITAGAGGDIIINSLFAVKSSMSLLGNIKSLSLELMSAKELFGQLFKFDFHRKIPLVSLLTLDDGFRSFQNSFEKILVSYINKHGTSLLGRAHQSIMNVIDKITTTLSDWIACLFPDTIGLAGEITKNILDYIVHNGYNYIYHLISVLSDNMQKMITNIFALKKLIRHSVVYMRNIIKNLDAAQFIRVLGSLGFKISDLIGAPILHKTISMGTKISDFGAKALKKVPKVSFVPKAQNIMVYVIDRYVIPNIDPSIDLFYQIFPIFLMFTLFIEKYPIIITKYPIVVKQTEKKFLQNKKGHQKRKKSN